MNALSEIGEILTAMKIPWQTGAYTEPAPDQYVVLVPLCDTFDIMAYNRPQFDVQAVRLSVFSKGNYNLIKNQLVRPPPAAAPCGRKRRFSAKFPIQARAQAAKW